MTLPSPPSAHALEAGSPHRPRGPADRLPRWPVTAMFAGFAVWWAVGLADVAAILMAVPMGLYLVRARDVRAPRTFGVWLFFLAWSAGSAVMLTSAGDAVAFAYRYSVYLACTVLAIYVYNARSTLTERYLSGCLTVWWLTTVAGGYLGLLLPTATMRTPMSLVLPQALLANDLVNHMVIRRFAQYNPDSFLQVAPRPSAPFLYTNNWGNVFSLLLPFVLLYLAHVRGQRRHTWLAVALVLSAVPAALTLNRGMFIGLGIALLYTVLRLAAMRHLRPLGSLALVAAVGTAAFFVLPVQERLDARLDESAAATSNDTRTSLYLQAVDLSRESPLFGAGTPQEGDNPDAAPVGTQGQFWMLLVSHGPVAAVTFVAWFVIAFARSRRRRDAAGIAVQTVLLVGTVELLYYGMVPYGLPIMMVALALALRGPDQPPVSATQGPPRHLLASAPGGET